MLLWTSSLPNSKFNGAKVKSSLVAVFTPRKSLNATNQGFSSLESLLLNIYWSTTRVKWPQGLCRDLGLCAAFCFPHQCHFSAGRWPSAGICFWWTWASLSFWLGAGGWSSLDYLTHLISCWHHTHSCGLLGFSLISRLGGLFCGPWLQDLFTFALATSLEISRKPSMVHMGISGSLPCHKGAEEDFGVLPQTFL